MSVLDYPPGKKKLIIGGVIGAIVLIIIIIIICVATSSGDKPGSYVLTQVPLVDGYNNLAQLLRICGENKLNEFRFDKDLSKETPWGTNDTCRTYTDLVRMKQGQIFGQVWYASAPCSAAYKDATSIVLEQIDVLKRLFNSYADSIQLVSTSAGFTDTYKRSKISAFIGVNGGHAIDYRLGVLRMFYDLGVRFLTFAPCTVPWVENKVNLRDFGKQIIREANRLGMILDLTGLSQSLALDVIMQSESPVIYSHTASSAIYGNGSYNIDDSIIREINNKKGLIMVTFDASALANNSKEITPLLAHIDHIASVGSVDIVALGSGFGLFQTPIAGINGTGSYPDLFDALKKYESKNKNIDWSSTVNLQKVASSNFIRVLNEVEKIRDSKAGNNPIEDWINTDYLKNIPEVDNCSTDPKPLPEPTKPTEPPKPTKPTKKTNNFYNPSMPLNGMPTIKDVSEGQIFEETIINNSEELNPSNPKLNIATTIVAIGSGIPEEIIIDNNSKELNPSSLNH